MSDLPPRSPLLFRRWQFKNARPYHGGGTTDKSGERYDKPKGYGVGLAEGTAALSHSNQNRLAHEKAAQQRLHRRHPDAGYVGSWREGHRIHYDPSAVVEDKSEAVRLAREKHQKAIWDFKKKKELQIREHKR